MKIIKHGLRLLIAGSSVAGFIGGWALLANAPKPLADGAAQPASVSAPQLEPLPTLEPLPSMEENLGGIQLLPGLPQVGFQLRPRLRTGGS